MSGLSQVILHPDETLASFLSRLARANGRSSLTGFINDFHLSPGKLHCGDKTEINRLALVIGVPADTLNHIAVKVDGKSIEYRGEVFHRLGIFRTQVRVCAHCLHDDEQKAQGKSGTRAYARGLWMMPSVHSCPHHNNELSVIGVRTGVMPDLYRTVEMNADQLATARRDNQRIPATEFERFVERRSLGVRSDGDILDAISLQTAIDLCQLLGMAALHGRKFRVRGAEDIEFRAAAERGFVALASGREGVFPILDKIANQKSQRTFRGGFAIYGNLYFVLDRPHRGPEYDGFRQLLREHVASTTTILANARVFGEVGEAGSFCITDLARKTNMNPRTVARYLAARGNGPSAPSVNISQYMNADVAGQVIAELSDTVTLSAATKLLGWSKQDCQRLAELGILVATIGKRRGNVGLMHRYSRSDISALKQGLVERATAKGSDLQTLRTLNRTILTGSDDVLRALFDGRLRRIAFIENPSLLDAVNLDLREVIQCCPAVTVSANAACELLSLKRPTLDSLLERGTFERKVVNRAVGIPAKDLLAFDNRYVTSSQIKADHGWQEGEFQCALASSGIMLAFPFDDVGEKIVTRADVPQLLASIARAN